MWKSYSRMFGVLACYLLAAGLLPIIPTSYAQIVRGNGAANLVRPSNPGASSSRRSPMPCFIGVHQNASQALFVDPLNLRARGVDAFAWRDRSQYNLAPGNWVITPLNSSLARIDWYVGNQFFALQAFGIDQPLECVPVSSSLSQLWRLQRFPGFPTNFLLESLEFPGYCATFYQDAIFLQPIAFMPTQQWWFDRPASLSLPPILQNTSQQVIPNPPLPPAKVSLVNTSQDRIIALIGEVQNQAAAREIEIPARGSIDVEMQRDAGSTIVETFELASIDGVWDRQERTYQVPPVPLYDISIYEVFLQSIAIDRTGTSPNPIEDVNYQPRSIGIFQVPPGDQLPQAAKIDVMQTARQSGNPGGVRPLPSKLKPASSANTGQDPLKSILNEIQSRRKDF